MWQRSSCSHWEACKRLTWFGAIRKTFCSEVLFVRLWEGEGGAGGRLGVIRLRIDGWISVCESSTHTTVTSLSPGIFQSCSEERPRARTSVETTPNVSGEPLFAFQKVSMNKNQVGFPPQAASIKTSLSCSAWNQYDMLETQALWGFGTKGDWDRPKVKILI